MRIGLLLLCFYGLLSTAAHASTLSTEDVSPDTYIFLSSPLNRLARGDLSGPGIIALKHGSTIDAHRSLLSSARSIKINPDADITVRANLPLVATGNITLLPGGNISLTNLAKKDLPSATLIPRLSGGDITIWKAATIPTGLGVSLSAGNISILPGGNISLVSPIKTDFPSVSLIPRLSWGDITVSSIRTIPTGLVTLSASDIAVLPGANISFGSGTLVPPPSAPGGKIVIASGGGITTMSDISVASVPLPASFSMLVTGLLALISLSRRSVSR